MFTKCKLTVEKIVAKSKLAVKSKIASISHNGHKIQIGKSKLPGKVKSAVKAEMATTT